MSLLQKVPWLFSQSAISLCSQFRPDFGVSRGEISRRSHLVLSSLHPSFTLEPEWFQLSLWVCAVWVMRTLGGYPRRRVHPARTLEGELDVCHADPGCHIFIYLRKQGRPAAIRHHFSLLQFSGLFIISDNWTSAAATTLSYHHALAVEIVARDHGFQGV